MKLRERVFLLFGISLLVLFVIMIGFFLYIWIGYAWFGIGAS
ncbi:MAG: hypothetical protein ACFFER_14370 [Candidatus Thorarchaeota archaeon]